MQLIIEHLNSSTDFFLQWFIYALVCLPAAFGMLQILPWRLRRKAKVTFIFLSLISLAIPLFGLIIALLISVSLKLKKPLKKDPVNYVSVDYPDFQHAPVKNDIFFGEASGFELVRNQNISKEKRKQILVAINQLNISHANRINSLALSDNLDEVRLYAHGLIEKKERDLSSEVKQLNERLLEIKDIRKAALYKKQIAEVLWEQIYQFLVGNETMIATMKKIKKNAIEAFNVLTEDMELPLLLTKIAIRESKLSEAKNWLAKAVSNEAPVYKIYSLQAEIEYMENHYHNIKNLIKHCFNPGIIGLQALVLFWTKYD